MMHSIFVKRVSSTKGLFACRQYFKFLSTKTLSVERDAITEESSALPFSDIPLVKGYPIIGSLLEVASNMDKFHELLERRVKEYGPIYREQIGFGEKAQQVFTANVKDWENIIRGENRGNPSVRRELWSMDAYTKKKGLPQSMVNMRGEGYERLKDGIKPLLMPRYVAKLVPQLSDVTNELMDLITTNIKTDGTIDDIREIIHKWTFECGGIIAFRTRFGLLTNDEASVNDDMLKFYNSARVFFKLLHQLETGLPHHKTLLTKTWKGYEQALDEFSKYISELYDKYGEYVTDRNVDLTDLERQTFAQTVVVASADTTAHTALWTLIELSRNPEVQEKLHDEISNAPVDELTSSNLQLPYLKGFLKEVFRVRPLTPIYNKTLAEDLVLSGYQVPIGCTVNLMLGAYNRDQWFFDADTVKPERWQRGKKISDNSTPVHTPLAVLPFGHGQRSCIGRRIAENELLIFITKVVQRFKLFPVKEYDSRFCLFVIPEGDVSLRLEERK